MVVLICIVSFLVQGKKELALKFTGYEQTIHETGI